MFTDKQTHVVSGAIAAVLFCIGATYLAFHHMQGIPVPASEHMSGRIAYTLRCDLFAVLMLLAGVICIGNQRFFTADVIDGEGTSLLRPDFNINMRYLANTAEQVLLLVPAHLVLATLLPLEQIKIIPILVGLFVFGRIAFWSGYHRMPAARAFGFGVSFYPTVAVLLYDVWLMVV